MKFSILHYPFSLFLLLLAACAPTADQGPDERYANELITRKDRNGDKTYDYELHRFPSGDQPNWELLDTDYDGTFDQKITYAYTLRYEQVNIPVASAPASLREPTPAPTPRVRTFNN